MKKVINITIGGIVFPIEEDAYEKLQKYLNEIKKHFSKTGDAEEILEDIEIGIAEKFTKKRTNPNQSISLTEIETVIKEIGTIHDFETEDTTEPEPQKSQPTKLYRDGENKIIAGVASGIAAYFNIDPTIIRLIFVISVLLGGSGVLIYLILWAIVPEAKTTTEKLEMRGETLTLSTIEESIKKGVDHLKKKDFTKKGKLPNKIKGFFANIFALLGKFISKIVPLFAKIIGLILFLFGLFGVLSLGVGTVILLKTGTLFSDQAPLQIINSVFTGWEYYLVGTMAYLLVAIPLLFILIIGISFMKRKNKFRLSIFILLLTLWFGAIATTAFVTIDKIPVIKNKVETYRENLEIYQKNTELKPFSEISISDSINTTIKEGENFSVHIEGYEFVTEKLRISNSNNTLRIYLDNDLCFWCEPSDIQLTITIPKNHKLNSIELNGNSYLQTETLNSNNLDLDISGHSTIDITTLKTNALTSYISGVSTLNITNGQTPTGEIELSGLSEFNAPTLTFNSLSIEASGKSKATVQATNTLQIDASGFSKINYTAPSNTKITTDLSGDSKANKIIVN